MPKNIKINVSGYTTKSGKEVSDYQRSEEVRDLTEEEQAKLDAVKNALDSGKSEDLDPFVNRKIKEANQNEKPTTEDVVGVIESLGGEMKGLDFRVKGEGSTLRKVKKEMDDNSWDLSQVESENLNDALRYTGVL